jgi:hypothetical protein
VQEVIGGRSQKETVPAKTQPYLTYNQKGWGMAQMVDCQLSMHKGLSSNPSTTKKKKEEFMTNFGHDKFLKHLL